MKEKKAKSKATPPTAHSDFTIVAIGASAGGMEAVIEFFKNLSPNTGMAFLYVQHLSPDHKSMLSSLLAKTTDMNVQEATNKEKMLPNNVYVIPADKEMNIVDGFIKITPRPQTPKAHLPIDILFTSLAETHTENVIGIILSGSATDGTRGMKSIKHEGGLTFAQDASAKFGSMPMSAIAAGAVDFVLSPKEIAQEISRLSTHPFVISNGNKKQKEKEIDNNDPDLKIILNLLYKAHRVDFSQYKMSTIKRRIMRRMLLYKTKSLKEYAKMLREKTDEPDILYQDLLINVTAFFRDTEAHHYLKTTLLPKLLKAKKPDEPLRIWVAACATGEEAYSIAIALLEIQSSRFTNIPVQIFATDLDATAINKARIGDYSKNELEEVSPKRLQRFYTKSENGYRVAKQVRDMCVFAQHNILTDPPFAHVDLVSCCNLLIYLDIAAQKKAIATFHYALNDKGFLMLGKSESIGTSTQFFSIFNKLFKIFLRKSRAGATPLPVLTPRFTRLAQPDAQLVATGRKTVKNNSGNESGLDRAIDAVMLSRYMPTSVIINEQLEILQFRGSTDLYISPTTGKASLHILKMTRPEIAFELRPAISQAIKTKRSVRKFGIEIKMNDVMRNISIEVVPLKVEWDEPVLLILFNEHEQTEILQGKPAMSKSGAAAKDRRIKKLEEQLEDARADMLAFTQEQEAFNEELQSANEEVVSSNEELQTINEELETSKEEIESTNEELSTTNQELQTRNELLNESYHYTETLLLTVPLPLIILDSAARVKSANKAFYKKYNVVEEETEGHRIYDLGNGQWKIPKLRDLLENIIPENNVFENFEVEHEFESIGKRIMLLNARRIRLSGQELILLAIGDVTEVRKLALEKSYKEKEALQLQIEAQTKLAKLRTELEGNVRRLFMEAPALICVFRGPQHVCELANEMSLRFVGKRDILGKPIRKALPELEGQGFFELLDNVYSTGESFIGNEVPSRLDKGNGKVEEVYFNFVYQPSHNNEGEIDGIFVHGIDVSEQVLARKKIEEAEKQQTFLLKLSDSLRPLGNAIDIEEAATKIALDFMGADRCYYSTIEGDNVIILQDASREDLPSVAGVHSISGFALYKAVLQAGRPFVVDDVSTTNILDEDLKKVCLQFQYGSFINVPIIKNGKAVGLFSVVQNTPRKWTDVELQLTIETAERTWAAEERAKAEEALRKSEEKYRTLFTSIDQGFAHCELVRNKEGKGIDFYVLEVNPTYEKQSGVSMEMVLGKTILQVFPTLDKWWIDTYAAMVNNQRPVAFEHYFEITDRWLTINAYPGEKDRFSVLFNDITERKRREANLVFLAEINLDFAPLLTPQDVMHQVAEKLANFLHLSRCHFSLIDEEQDRLEVVYDYRADEKLPSIMGVHSISDNLTEEGRRHYSSGKIGVLNTTADSPLVKAPAHALKELGFGSVVALPHLEAGRWKFTLTIARAEEGEWRSDEIELLQELTSRIYIRIERARAEEALGKTEERLRLATQASDIYWWEFDFKTSTNLFSSNTEQVMGAAPAKTMEENLLLLHPDDRALPARAFEEAIKNSTGQFNYLVRSIAVPSELRWLQVSGRLIRDDQNQPMVAVGITQNITERKQAEEKIKESESRFRTMADASPMLIWTIDANGLSSFYNKTFLDFVGATKDEDISDWEKIVHPDDVQSTLEKINTAIAEHRSYSLECRLFRVDGQWRWMLAQGNPRLGTTNEFLGFVSSSVDITERKEVEEALGYRTALLEAHNEASVDGILLVDAKGKILSYNKRFVEIWNMPQHIVNAKDDDAALSFAMTQLVNPQQFIDKVKYLYAHPTETCHDELEFKAGKIVERNGYPVVSENGTYYAWSWAFRDITAQKDYENKIIESQLQFSTLANNIQNLAWIADGDGWIYWYNQRWYDYTGTNLEEMKGWGWEKVHHPDHLQRVVDFVKQAWKKNEPFELTFPLRGADGKFKWFLTRAVPITDGEGKILRWIGTNTDIEEQKVFSEKLEERVNERTTQLNDAKNNLEEKNEALAESANRIQTIFEAAPDAVITMDHHGIITEWNEEAENIFGWKKDEVLEKPLSEIIIPERYRERHKNGLKNFMRTGEGKLIGRPIEIEALKKDNTEIPVELKISSSAVINHPPVFIGFVRDITSRKKAENEIVQKNKDLENMNKELEAFTYISSHDLQEPLRKIQTFSTHLLERENENLSDTGKDYFLRMQKAANRMQTLIQDLLAFSRVNTSERKFELTDFGHIIKEVKSEFKETITEKKATIETGEMCEVKIIPFQFRQLIQNLLSNALKFSKPGIPPHITINIEKIPARSSPILNGEPAYHIIFTDNGIGFEPQFSEKVFQVFQRLHSKDEYQGTGIGLAIVKKIVENHNGVITATSELSSGVRFDIYIPV